MTAREELARRYTAKAKAGLTDVKFHFDLSGTPTVEKLCEEVLRLDDAVRSGKCRPLKFNDSYTKGPGE